MTAVKHGRYGWRVPPAATEDGEPRPNQARRLTARGRERRLQLITYATRRFAEDGFHPTSVAEIVTGIGVGKGVFYWYFDSEEELFVEILRAAHKDLHRTQMKAITGIDDPVQRIEEGYEVERCGWRAIPTYGASSSCAHRRGLREGDAHGRTPAGRRRRRPPDDCDPKRSDSRQGSRGTGPCDPRGDQPAHDGLHRLRRTRPRGDRRVGRLHLPQRLRRGVDPSGAHTHGPGPSA
ncbi:MAG: TetR/AcrR family transcriptional regulator [Microthrixaceae bacterium]|nr:TetR/AcrR family transcriptional regulator [Microthrixaceae bacterium]